MNESELLAHIERRSRSIAGRDGVIIGPGDDAAALHFSGTMLATVDHLVEGRHFEAASASMDQIARKAVARSVSDIAAMGGEPAYALATGCLPRTSLSRADELFDRMAHWASHWGCPLIGGDIAVFDGPMVLTVTVLGRAHPLRGPVTRSGARVGDRVYVTGRLGGALGSGRHLTFEPRLREAKYLCEALGDRLHAMIDLSDGLGRDAGRVARASGVRIEIDSAHLPAHEELGDWRAAVGDGEDYELLIVADSSAVLHARCPDTGVPITPIGGVTQGEGCFIVTGSGERIDATGLGWDHR